MVEIKFSGFSKETIKFFEDLTTNNNKTWFNENKKDYEKYVMEPARTFVIKMGERLYELSPDINAIPLVNKSLFRLNRDVRFSKDKSPYKTNMGILFWEGTRKRMECPGFYFHVESNKLMLGGGLHKFTKDIMDSYRKQVAKEKSGKALVDIIENLKLENIDIGGLHYKRVPRGFDDDNPNAELLKYNGLYTMINSKIPNEFYSEKLIEYCYERFKKSYPLNEWILTYL